MSRARSCDIRGISAGRTFNRADVTAATKNNGDLFQIARGYMLPLGNVCKGYMRFIGMLGKIDHEPDTVTPAS